MDVITGPVISILLIALNLYTWVVIIGVILSWLVAFNVVNTSNKFVYMVGDFCYRATEPLLGRIRGFLPNLGGLDISPVVLILGLVFLKEFLIRLAHKIV
ncbi:YggT family protein [Thalassospiraceae bacterium LMO-SO8]|jgi:YggT family protein|nr:YggT family protein [Alphaproteobacteria bacterium LMO-S08]WND77437.1 YggT family protein [Thalassospiraceae bacterium LMO-SO8]|tara:strand:+ start:11131 stop:11430 length:300 start_codon:yes stop_codon:yes gene_type:complete